MKEYKIREEVRPMIKYELNTLDKNGVNSLIGIWGNKVFVLKSMYNDNIKQVQWRWISTQTTGGHDSVNWYNSIQEAVDGFVTDGRVLTFEYEESDLRKLFIK